MSDSGQAVTNVRTYTAFVGLSPPPAINTSLNFAKRLLAPGHDTTWDIVRVWTVALGYDAQTNPAPASINGATLDPYHAESGDPSTEAKGTYIVVPVAMMFRNTIAPENLIQAFHAVPRTFEPIDLNSPARIQPNDQIVFLAGELWNANFGNFTDRVGRGVTFGFDANEIIQTS